MAEFESFARVPGFRPRAVVDTAGQVREQTQKELNQMREFFNSRRITDQQLIEDSRFAGQNWKALASLTESGVKYYEQLAKQESKDKATGEMWTNIFNPEYRTADFETPYINEAERQNIIAKAAADGLEADGDLIGSEIVRQRYQGLGQGLTNERVLAQKIKTSFPSELTAFVNSEEMVRYKGVPVPINQLFGSSDIDKVQFALNAAAVRILEKNNAQFMTKDTLVKYLGEVVPSTIGYMTTNQLTGTIAQQKEERLATAKTQGYNYGAISTDKNVTQNYQSLAQTLLNDNNGITTIQRANRVAAEVMFNGAASVSEDQVKVVGNSLQNPTQANSFIRGVAPLEYLKAIELARSNTAKADKAFGDETVNKALADITKIDPANLDAKLARLEEAEAALQKRGMYEAIIDLRSKAGVYTQGPEATANYMRMQKQQASGTAIPDATISQQVASGELTPEQAASLRSQRTTVFKAPLSSATATVTIQNRDFASEIALRTGTTVDSASGEFKIGSKPSPINAMDLKTINKAYEKALKADLDKFAMTLDPSLSPTELNDKMEARAKQFRKEQVENPNGRFHLGGLFTEDPNAIRTANTPEYERVRQAARQFSNTSLAKPSVMQNGANDYSNKWNPGQGLSQQIRQAYKPGDRLLDPKEALEVKLDAEQGMFRPETIQAARDLGLTPKQYADQQAAASQLNPINWQSASAQNAESLAETSMMREIRGTSQYQERDIRPGREGYRLTAVSGIPIFLSRGFSLQGASLLSAKFYLESQARQKDMFNEATFADKYLAKLTPEQLAVLKNPNLTYRQLANWIGDPKLTSYAKTLEQLYGIK